jgi:hypothetical protein
VVAGDDLADSGLVPLWCREERRELTEVVLEPGGRDQLEQAGGLVARVPEGMGDVPGLEDEVARSGLELFGAELEADAAFQDIGVLVLPAVGVQRCAKGAGGSGCSTRLNAPPVVSPVIMKRTPRASRCTTSPLSGPSRWPTAACIWDTLSIDALSIES